jgi:N-formylglutamate deformylase
VLPDLNIGTAGGASAHPSITAAVSDAAHAGTQYSVAVNGRFKGGYITRHYGNPAQRVHAVQLEKCQCLYMDERRGDGASFAYDEAAAARVQPLLRRLVATMAAWRPDVG